MATRLQGKLLGQRALFQRLQSNKKRGKLAQAGFTLIEILIAVVILGVLSAIALPNFLNVSKDAEDKANSAKAAAEARVCGAQVALGSNVSPCAVGKTFTGGGETWTVGDGGTVTGPT